MGQLLVTTLLLKAIKKWKFEEVDRCWWVLERAYIVAIIFYTWHAYSMNGGQTGV